MTKIVSLCDVGQSFAKGIDMEDLGLRDASAMSCDHSSPLDLPDDIGMPSWLKEHVQVGNAQNSTSTRCKMRGFSCCQGQLVMWLNNCHLTACPTWEGT